MPLTYYDPIAVGSGSGDSSGSGSGGSNTVIIRENNTETIIENGRHTPVNLKEKYTIEELLAEINKGVDSALYPGDYYPVTLSGSFKNFASDAYGVDDEIKFSNLTVRLEIAAVNPYLYYGDEGVFANGAKHVVFICRDALPAALQMRSQNTAWYDDSATNPWVGSAMYKTLNDNSNGLIQLFKQTELGPYIYTGTNNEGMRHVMETKPRGATMASGMGWGNRGALFLCTEKEIWGSSMYSNPRYGSGGAVQQFPIFALAGDYTSKKFGAGSNPCNYWCESSVEGTNNSFCRVAARNFPYLGEAALEDAAVAPCFIVCGRGA